MVRKIRCLLGAGLVEFTVRTAQSRFLLRPSEQTNALIVGILGRCLERHPLVQIHAIAVMSNHIHGMTTVPDAGVLAAFMRDFNSLVARKIGNLVGWENCGFWGRRYQAIEILDRNAALSRLKYILSQGCKEDLVTCPTEWPGVHCAHSLLSNTPLRGFWLDQSKYSEKSRKHKQTQKGQNVLLDSSPFRTWYEVHFTPIPLLGPMSSTDYQNLCTKLVSTIRNENQQRREHQNKQVLGVKAIRERDPLYVPPATKSTPAPAVHTTCPRLSHSYKSLWKRLVYAYYEARQACRLGRPFNFPLGTFPSTYPLIVQSSSSEESDHVPAMDLFLLYGRSPQLE